MLCSQVVFVKLFFKKNEMMETMTVMMVMVMMMIQLIELVARRLKIKKATQTIMHCTTKQYNTRNEIKHNAMQWNKMNQG